MLIPKQKANLISQKGSEHFWQLLYMFRTVDVPAQPIDRSASPRRSLLAAPVSRQVGMYVMWYSTCRNGHKLSKCGFAYGTFLATVLPLLACGYVWQNRDECCAGWLVGWLVNRCGAVWRQGIVSERKWWACGRFCMCCLLFVHGFQIQFPLWIGWWLVKGVEKNSNGNVTIVLCEQDLCSLIGKIDWSTTFHSAVLVLIIPSTSKTHRTLCKNAVRLQRNCSVRPKSSC